MLCLRHQVRPSFFPSCTFICEGLLCKYHNESLDEFSPHKVKVSDCVSSSCASEELADLAQVDVIQKAENYLAAKRPTRYFIHFTQPTDRYLSQGPQIFTNLRDCSYFVGTCMELSAGRKGYSALRQPWCVHMVGPSSSSAKEGATGGCWRCAGRERGCMPQARMAEHLATCALCA